MPVVQSGVVSTLLYGPMHIFHAFASNRQHTTTEPTPIDALLRGRPEFKNRPVLTSKGQDKSQLLLLPLQPFEPEDRDSTRQHFCLRPGQSTHPRIYLKEAIFSLPNSPFLRTFVRAEYAPGGRLEDPRLSVYWPCIKRWPSLSRLGCQHDACAAFLDARIFDDR